MRDDSAHGRAYRDTLDWNGDTVDKFWLPEGIGANEALTVAEADLAANADRYRNEFLGSKP